MRSSGGVDLDELDSQLRALGVDLDEDDDPELTDTGTGPATNVLDDDPPHPAAPRSWWDCADDPAGVPAAPMAAAAAFDADPELDLPAPVAPPGYLLDRRGVLRYAHDRSCVPGQQRVTLARLWRFERDDTNVYVPQMWVRTRPELWWCTRVVGPDASTRIAGVSVAAHPVPAEVWDRYAAHPIGVTAPELAVGNMLDAAAVADLAGLSRSAVPTYLARGVLPEPQARVANSPLWSLPPLGVWLASRRDPGRPRRRRRRDRP